MLITLVIGLLTLALVLNCLLLILMVLVQLPKKEAGLGMAFGAATADALFGAGSGTVLTRWTKYATGSFLVLALVLSVLRNHQARASGRNIAIELQRQGQAAISAPATPTNAPLPVLSLPPSTNPALMLGTNLPASTGTGAPVTLPFEMPAIPVTNPAGTGAPAVAPQPGSPGSTN